MTVHAAVFKALNTRWMTGYELVRFVKQQTGILYSESAITARCRDLRKPQYGGHEVVCRHFMRTKGKSVYEYGIPV